MGTCQDSSKRLKWWWPQTVNVMARNTIAKSEFAQSGNDLDIDDVDLLLEDNAILYHVSEEGGDGTGVVVVTEDKRFASPWIDLHDYEEDDE